MSKFFKSKPKNTDIFLKKLKQKKAVLGAVIVFITAALLIALVLLTIAFVKKQAKPLATQKELLIMWKANEYSIVKASAQEALELYPLNPFYLTMFGYASFYLALSEPDTALKAAKMDEAIFSIRKALLDKKTELRPESLYILGKAYFYKGKEYYYDCIENLEESIKMGFILPDSWEYLALAYLELAQYQKSALYFEKAIEITPDSSELLLNAALVYKLMEDYERTELLANSAKDTATDDFVLERCNFLLAELYMKSGKIKEALLLYEDIIARNPESADGWYYQGLALLENGDALRARAAWRKAVSIDPMHNGARQKLLERL